jgi:ketosteroid isomerase-like protein
MRSSEENKAAARTCLETAEHGDVAVLDAIVSPDYVLHDPSLPEPVRGVEGMKAMVEAYRNAFGRP